MRDLSSFGWFTFSLRVNGIEFDQASLRSRVEHPTNFEVMIRDRQFGRFALHDEFILEIPNGDEESAGWRPVSLLELKAAIWKSVQMVDSSLVAGTCTASSSSHARQRSSHGPVGRIPVEEHSNHVDNLRNSLLGARIQYQIVGGLDSRGRIWGHLTAAVSSLFAAVTCLRRAGFLESRESEFLLIDSRTGWKVRLLEGRNLRSR